MKNEQENKKLKTTEKGQKITRWTGRFYTAQHRNNGTMNCVTISPNEQCEQCQQFYYLNNFTK
ncbi:hypothetical protein KO465_04965 [Candidatus Micrarchaeota archaeon]|nr:hypothetical protein [Candidatus Micrarchaeota archaeon]